MAEVVIPNGYGTAVLSWSNTQLSKDPSVTIGVRDLGVSNDPSVIAAAVAAAFTVTDGFCDEPNMNTGWTFQPVYVLLRTTAGVLTSGFGGGPVDGTNTFAGQTQPAYSPLVVTKRTALAGRQYRGRMYAPLMWGGESGVDANGRIESGATLPHLQDSLDETYDALVGGTVTAPYLLHAPPNVGSTPVPTLIQGFQVQPVVGTQRRRKPRS